MHKKIGVWEFIMFSPEEKAKVRWLDLYGSDFNYLSLEDFTTFCKSLIECQDLQYLDLNDNGFEGLDIVHFQDLCTAITQCQRLKQLGFANHKLGNLKSSYFKALCITIAQCKELEALDLRDNKLDRLDKESLQLFYKSICQCQTLIKVDFESSDVVFNKKINDILQLRKAKVDLPKAKEESNKGPASLLFLASKLVGERFTLPLNKLPQELQQPIEHYRMQLREHTE